MNKYLKMFLHRGLIFAGFGPVITGIVYFIISKCIDNFSVSGDEMLFVIISTYILAFVHSGASVFNQIEEWPITKSMLFHFSTLYAAYMVCYLFNDWIAFDLAVIGIFTAVFVIGYFAVWAIVLISMKLTEKRLNARLK